MALADATVRVILDVSRFDRDLQTKVASAARRAGRRFESEFTKTVNTTATSWVRKFQEQANKSLIGAGTRAGRNYANAVGRSARPAGRLVGRDLGGQIRGGLLQTANNTGRQFGRNLLVGSLTDAGNRIGQRLGRAVQAGINVTGVGVTLRQQIEEDSGPHVLAAARTVASRFGAAFGAALGGASISRFGLLAAGVIGLVAEGTQLAAALEPAIQVIGLFPAAASVAAVSISTLAVAFQGMGDALSAAAEGDAEKLAEALANLSPAAASVVQEFAALMPQLTAIRREVQQAFFSELVGDLTRLGEALLGPVQRGMTSTAAAAGRMTSALTETLGQVRNATAIEEIFNSAARGFDQMAAPLQQLTTGMLQWTRATLPAFDQLVVTIGNGATRFGDFLSQAAASGQAMAWVNESITTLSQLGRVALNAGRLIGTIFDAARASSGSYLLNLNNVLIATRQFLAVGEGRTGLVSIFEGLRQVVQALAEPLRAAVVAFGQISQVAGSVAGALSSGVAAAIRGIGQALENAGPGLTEFAQAVGGVFGDLGEILPSVGQSFGQLLSAAAPLVSVFGVAATVAASLLSVIAALPGPLLLVIGAFVGLRALGVPNLISQIQLRATSLGSAFDAANTATTGFSGVFARMGDVYRANIASLTAMRIEQQVTTNAMSSGIPSVNAFGAAVGSMADRARAAGVAVGSNLTRGVQSLIGALGGGIGIALTAASVLIGIWASEQQKADQAVAEHNTRVRQLGSTLDKVTGSITNATREQARQTFASSEMADAATRLGLSIDQVSDAATGSEAAQRRMLTQLHDSARGAVEASRGYEKFKAQTDSLGASMDDLISAAMGNEDALNRLRAGFDGKGMEINLTQMLKDVRKLIPDQLALADAVSRTSADLQRQAQAIQNSNAQIGPAERLANSLADAMSVLANNSSSAADKARALDTALRLLNGGTVELADAQKASADAVASGGQQMQTLADKYNIAGKSAAELGISTQELAARQAELDQALFDSSGQINFASERARGLYEVSKSLRQATLDQTAAIVENGQKTGNVADAHKRASDLMEASRQQVINWAIAAGFGDTEAARFADSLGLIPENVKVALEMQNVPAIMSQLSQIKGGIELLPDKKSLRLDSNARSMQKELEDLGFEVQDIPGSKDIKITPNTAEAAAALQAFIAQQVTARDADLMVDANTSAAQLTIDQIQGIIAGTHAELTPTINSPPVIAEWQNLLLGPLNTPPGTPTVTPGVNPAEVTGWFDTYLQGLAPPGTPTITPGVDPGSAIAGMEGMEHLLPIPFIAIVPIVDGKPAYDQMEGLIPGLTPPPGDPTITPGVDGTIAEDWLDYYLNQTEKDPPVITPEVNPGPASFQLDGLKAPIEGSPQITPAANTLPVQGQIQGLIMQINGMQTSGPVVNGNITPANAALALLLALINQAQGNVDVGANTGPGYGATNALVNYVNSTGGSVDVFANTGGAYNQVNELVRYINTRSATINVTTQQSGSIAAAEGGLYKFFSGGGVNSFRNTMRSMPASRAEIVPAKTMRVIGDRARGDEAFIPLVNSARSRAILHTASNRLGFDLVPRQSQQQVTERTTTVEAGAIVVNAPYSNPFLVARAVVNELTREAVV